MNAISGYLIFHLAPDFWNKGGAVENQKHQKSGVEGGALQNQQGIGPGQLLPLRGSQLPKRQDVVAINIFCLGSS